MSKQNSVYLPSFGLMKDHHFPKGIAQKGMLSIKTDILEQIDGLGFLFIIGGSLELSI